MTNKNRELKIATATTKTSAQWTNTHTTLQDLTAKAHDPVIVDLTTAEYSALSKGDKDKHKDVGGFVGGHLKQGRRRKGHVLTRSLITLDLDNLPADTDLPAHLGELEFAWLAHTTLSHTADNPRWRVWIWLQRDITADEYGAISRRVAQDINPGLEWFDPSTFEPERLMYWPATLTDGDYHVHISHGRDHLNPDDVFTRFDTWQDVTTWPGITPDQAKAFQATGTLDDPRGKPGMLGAFNRAYSIETAIRTFLPEVYKPGTTKDRWTYTQGTSSNGLIIYNGGHYAYSQHATDPAADGHSHSAFDLVRIHKYGHLDTDTPTGTPANKHPSYVAMMDMVNEDPGARAENAKATAAMIDEMFQPVDSAGEGQQLHEMKELPDPDAAKNTAAGEQPASDKDWLLDLETKKDGGFKDTIGNFELILTHDPRFNHIAWNAHASQLEIRDPGALPWDQVKPGWTDNDDARLKTEIARSYGGLYAPSKMNDALLATASARAFHPVRDYFNHLMPWDGVERLDTLLIDTLGAEDTDYTRAVTRKTLVAAHRRTFQPGCKFDHVLTLVGPQGVGKSTIFARLAGNWFSDSLTITDMRDKTGAEKLLGNLIVELSELAGMRKAEAEPVKGFISRTEDKFRPAYGRVVETFPRQCIIVGSTNADEGFLRDTTGNRRWWPVHVTGEGWLGKPHDLDQHTIDQLWAEARHRDKEGEKLFLEGDVLAAAEHIQAESVEADDRIGIVQEYLDKVLPPNWDAIPLGARRIWLDEGYLPDNLRETGMWNHTAQRRTVSKIEIWSECFGRDPDAMEKRHAHEITAIMQQVDGWEDSGKRTRLPIYGLQRVYQRVTQNAENHGHTGRGAAA
ncbi:virulence-associated E family protein [Corynebacterium qintianiae]|uniref:virulence-associated E family protein n=1 Tax=Corynebacterium qintianiae TaxID=2709392 RepID=UPI0013EE370F|nr:virulence-associated E family protein [Corynebacterium qintianiae]